MTALVSVKNVKKSYIRGKQKVEVLHGLNLDVGPGEFLALMGPSGSGKSTLLNLISGLDRPNEGEVVVGGERIDQLSNSQLAKWRARRIGFVFQFYHLMPMLSAERNVERYKTITMVTHDPKTAEHASRQVHLDKGRLCPRPSPCHIWA